MARSSGRGCSPAAIARAVHKSGEGVPVKRIGSVCCVSTDTVKKALRSEEGDNLDDNVKFELHRGIAPPARLEPMNNLQDAEGANNGSVELDAGEQSSTELITAQDDDLGSIDADTGHDASGMKKRWCGSPRLFVNAKHDARTSIARAEVLLTSYTDGHHMNAAHIGRNRGEDEGNPEDVPADDGTGNGSAYTVDADDTRDLLETDDEEMQDAANDDNVDMSATDDEEMQGNAASALTTLVLKAGKSAKRSMVPQT
ncbi:hypothetical protein C8R43DRAFT_950833 [Mycena crocata]|nr:hypothetical protein C8R43DRAFT_950833 [Mycena crocata]